MSLISTSSEKLEHESLTAYWYRAASRMGRVVFALMIREMKVRYGRSKAGYALAFISPAIRKGLLVLLMVLANKHSPIGPSIVLFYWCGLVAFHMFSYVVNNNLNCLKQARNVRQLPIVRSMDYVLARSILEVVTDLIIAVAGFALIYVFDTEMAIPCSPLWAIEALALMLTMAFGLSLVNAVIVVFFYTWSHVWRVVSILLMLSSGIYHLNYALPPQVRNIVAYNPVAHGIEMFRMGFYPSYPAEFLDESYLIYWAFGSLLMGLMLERVTRRKVAAYR